MKPIKNKKAIDPRYFLHETAQRIPEGIGDFASSVRGVGGRSSHFGPLEWHEQYGEPYSPSYKIPSEVGSETEPFVILYTDSEGKKHSWQYPFSSMKEAESEAVELFDSERRPQEVEIYSLEDNYSIWSRDRKKAPSEEGL